MFELIKKRCLCEDFMKKFLPSATNNRHHNYFISVIIYKFWQKSNKKICKSMQKYLAFRKNMC